MEHTLAWQPLHQVPFLLPQWAAASVAVRGLPRGHRPWVQCGHNPLSLLFEYTQEESWLVRLDPLAIGSVLGTAGIPRISFVQSPACTPILPMPEELAVAGDQVPQCGSVGA